MRVRGLQTRPAPGTRVRFTGYFLAATGQRSGAEGSKRFTVVACDCGCATSEHIAAVDEPLDTSIGYDDLPPEQRPKWRHVAIGNLEIVGTLPRAANLPDELPPDAPWPVKKRAA